MDTKRNLKTFQDEDVFAEFYRVFWKFFRRLRIVNETYGLPIPLTKATALVLTETFPGITGSRIAQITQLDKSTVSRITASLEKDGFLKSSENVNDSRSRTLVLTAKGRKMVRAIDDAGNRIFSKWAENLSSLEQQELNRCFRELADGLGAAPDRSREGEHPLRCHMRRAARHFGLLGEGEDVYGLSSSQRHVMTALSEHRGDVPPSARDLVEELGVDQSTLSRVIAKLRARGVLTVEQSRSDKRSQSLRLSPEGRSLMRATESEGGAKVRAALSGMTITEVRKFLSLFKRFFSDNHSELRQKHSVQVTAFLSDKERSLARSFLVRHRMQSGMADSLPATIFSADSMSAGVLENGQLRAVIEIRQVGGRFTITNFAADDDVRGDASLCRRLVASCIGVKEHETATRIDVEKGSQFPKDALQA